MVRGPAIELSASKGYKPNMPIAKKPVSLGNKSDKIWAHALRRAVMRLSPDGKSKQLEVIANRVVKLAADGDIAAAKEIGDRLDGKPSQAVETNLSGHFTVSWKK